jgi:cytochrome c oxidase subunit 2
LPRLGFPEPATEEGPITLWQWQSYWVTALIVGGITLFLILFAALYYRRRGADAPPQTRYNIPIEILYTVVPLVIVAVLFVYTARDESKLTAMSDNPDKTVSVVGFRWNWTFNYVDDNAYDVGSPNELPTLWLPVDQTIEFKLTSPDVIHSFWVPDFLFKRDVIPGRLNEFQLTPNKLGTFSGKCAELCGVDHSRMLFNVKVVTPEEYRRHIAELKAKGQDGLLETGRSGVQATDAQGRTTIGGGS